MFPETGPVILAGAGLFLRRVETVPAEQTIVESTYATNFGTNPDFRIKPILKAHIDRSFF